MKIVVDTNVVISGIFFGGVPRKIVEAVADGAIDAYATAEILDEYMGIIASMIERKQGRINQSISKEAALKHIIGNLQKNYLH